MAFTRNTGTNLFPLILGLFLEIGGTGSRILNALSNAGVCVSVTTIEHLKKVLPEDVVAHTVTLMQSPSMFYLIFDNINIFLCKSQRFNKNLMIRATKTAVIALPDALPVAADFDTKQKVGESVQLQWGRTYCPPMMVKKKYHSHPKKLDGQPLGLFNMNKGSKKGIIQMLKALQEISGLPEAEWAAKAQIIIRDWLNSNNIRGTHKDHMDDINAMEHLNYIDELSIKHKDAHPLCFIRDALIFCIFEPSVVFADAGGILRVLKYWALSFRGAGLHNYACECLEILLQWKYELTPEAQAVKKQAWFSNHWGLRGHNIASDLYLEQNNFWVKHVNIATGSGVTVKYIIKKGSAAVEAFHKVSYQFARTFGFMDYA
ncbi:hypothetical protein DFH08DRAFT_802365 [Mycena albidolilacea]|uniref:DUF6589 domain-containing protein n=1 Tax=Mycena albidolilacea TaxID=1033008 RepID=A0AAD7AH72_9AGAR|nr:hypothetical protein DFH08DRAFT_802365 [Mycena albidolilacea]